jgi:EpsI family protein
MTGQQRHRVLIAAAIVFAMAAALRGMSRQEIVPPRESFARFPQQIGAWTGQKGPDFDKRVLEILGVDEYVNWTMRRGDALAGLYIGYWGSQRHGDTMHSPMNCLPGSGWEPMERRTIAIQVGSPTAPRTIAVNRIVIEKGLDRQLVLYWYQSQQRVVASEYAGKLHTVLDAIRYNRSDAAMIRIVVPLGARTRAAEDAAERTASELVQQLFPVLPRFLPA